jgi:hypothetical protein
MRTTIALLGLSLAIACAGDKKDAPSPAPAPTPVPETKETAPAAAAAAIDPNRPETCQACHAAVVKEWGESMHARAHQSRDPIFGAMRKLRMEKQGADLAMKCAQCHQPADPKAAETAAAATTGVGCGGCHRVQAIDRADGKKGRKALVFADKANVFFGPHPPKTPAGVHEVGAPPAHMTDGSSLCLACHDATKTPTAADACTTGPEWRGGENAKGCVECHMPTVKGQASPGERLEHRSHAFLGPHRAWYQSDASLLEGAITLEATLRGSDLVIQLHNKSGHGFPTAFPGRMVLLHVTAADAKGVTVYASKDDKDRAGVLRLGKVYVDEAGKPTPAAFAKELKTDTRLKTDEKREIVVPMPKGAASAEVRVDYHLLPPPLAKKLGLADKPEAKPVTIAKVSVELAK